MLIKYRGAYSECIIFSYNEMLVIYILREFDFCTQKQIYDSYMLPRQAMSYTNSFMRANEIFELSLNYNIRGTDS